MAAAFGRLNQDIVIQARVAFEQKCVALLELACRVLKAKKSVNWDWGEENISANIYTYIHNSQMAIEGDIFVESEHNFYQQNVLDNKAKAKSSPRIDLVLQHNWSGQKMIYYVEAKNLIDHDCHKSGRKRKTKADAVKCRYIETGIDHFKNGYYPNGCLLGYVLNGTIAGVVAGINTLLENKGRSGEILQYASGYEPWMVYKSNHASAVGTINHYLFNFT